jgi:glyoxylase-like metal-dependent hydrolase (beta-lactamase superfamily II)
MQKESNMLRNVLGRIGDIAIGRVHDSTLIGETMQHWFPDFDREQVRRHEHWLCPDHMNAETGHFRMPVHSYVFQVSGKTVLIDTCNGNHKNRPDVGFSELHMLNTRYLERLAAAGVKPEQVDYVLCTHLHVDHVGWNTQLDNGRWVPTFPNARYVFSRTEYEATIEIAGTPGSPKFLRDVFEESIHPIVEAGLSDLVADGHELLGCVVMRPAPGHSPGHVRIELTSGGERAIFAGDLLHSPVQVPFWMWSSKMCWDRALAAQTRRTLLEDCAAQNALLLAGHFEAPYVGRIRQDGDTFAIAFGW